MNRVNNLQPHNLFIHRVKSSASTLSRTISALSARQHREDDKPVVSISCLTFNHENYIRDALDGFLNQKTTFPVEILIHDDASTDRTADIIREYATKYPDLIKPVCQKENKHSQGIDVGSLNTCRAKGDYIAYCEGDDYWTDPLKLEKQIRFLEDNPDFVACFGGYTRYNEVSRESTKSRIEPTDKSDENGFAFSLKDMQSQWLTKTLTAVVRKSAIREIDPTIYSHYRDIHFSYHLIKGRWAYYLFDNMGVYRIHPGGINSMKQGKVNVNAAYNCYREMYLNNKDEFTRFMCFNSTASLFNYNLFNPYPGNTLNSKFRLFGEMLHLSRGLREFRIILYSFVKRELKDYIKYRI